MYYLENRRYSLACERNKLPIISVLKENFPKSCRIIEIASGTGQHADFFTSQEPGWSWQSSDTDPNLLKSIDAYRILAKRDNFLPPTMISTLDLCWKIKKFDGAFCCNMIHASCWESTVKLFERMSHHLFIRSKLLLYGPFIEKGVETSCSNISFNKTLKKKNSLWGLRDLEDVILVAKKNGFEKSNTYNMPSNNLIVSFTLIS